MTAMLQHPIGPDTVEDWRECEHPADGSRLELIWGYFHVRDSTNPDGGAFWVTPHAWAVFLANAKADHFTR